MLPLLLLPFSLHAAVSQILAATPYFFHSLPITAVSNDKDGNLITRANTDVAVDRTLKGVLSLTLHVGADATSNNKIEVKIDSMSAAIVKILMLKQ